MERFAGLLECLLVYFLRNKGRAATRAASVKTLSKSKPMASVGNHEVVCASQLERISQIMQNTADVYSKSFTNLQLMCGRIVWCSSAGEKDGSAQCLHPRVAI